MKKNLLVFTALALTSCASSAGSETTPTPTETPSSQKGIASYEECVAAGFPQLRMYPPKCLANGKTFTQGRAAIKE